MKSNDSVRVSWIARNDPPMFVQKSAVGGECMWRLVSWRWLQSRLPEVSEKGVSRDWSMRDDRGSRLLGETEVGEHRTP